MPKNYCPVRIKNPISKNSLVRLLANQKMHIVFSGQDFADYKMDVVGDYLAVEEVSEVHDGWMASIYQKTNLISYHDSSLLLGGINLFDTANSKTASLCVVTNNENNDFLRVINPVNSFCNLSPDQVLDVVFYGGINENWAAYPSPKELCLELIQNSIKPTKHIMKDEKTPLMEYFFRFRFTQHSIEKLSHLPFAKMEAGSIVFVNSKQQRGVLRVTCCWRGKSSIYKALLLPRIPSHNFNFFGKKQNKMCLQSKVVFKKIESNSLDHGCTVLQSKV